jgi:hypothetical protein
MNHLPVRLSVSYSGAVFGQRLHFDPGNLGEDKAANVCYKNAIEFYRPKRGAF